METTQTLRQLLDHIDAINPVRYTETRNFTDGSVTGLSPYISRGVISTRLVAQRLLAKHDYASCSKLIQELLWHDYFQRLQQHRPSLYFEALRPGGVTRRGIPLAVMHGKTGIHAIDDAIETLYQTGRMHNHVRMYLAAICCPIAHCHFEAPARWLYYHLLDGDVASNFGSWQWVAGNLTGKSYVANQENIDRYTRTSQRNTFLDIPYEKLGRGLPDILADVTLPVLETHLPATELPVLSRSKVLLYTHYNLDPLWHAEEDVDRVLVLEPSHFRRFPVGEVVLRFVFDLMKQIRGLKLYCGEVDDLLQHHPSAEFTAKEHPLFAHWNVTFEDRDWIIPHVDGFFSSFSKYYHQCQKHLPEYDHV